MRFLDGYDQLTDGVITLRLTEQNPGGGGMLPFYYYDIFDPDGPVGKISIRIGDNAHSYYNGHIGYEIGEAHRGRHYALRACKLVLPVAKAHGMQSLYLTCTASNIASRKILEGLGPRCWKSRASRNAAFSGSPTWRNTAFTGWIYPPEPQKLNSRCGGIGRHKGLKIPRRRLRTGSSPVSGTISKR